MIKILNKLLFLPLTLLILVCGCHGDNQPLRPVAVRHGKTQLIPGPLLPQASCCKGSPSRARTLGAKK